MMHKKDFSGALPSMFNCSNDMALAANVSQYVPPKRIQQMEMDLVDLARVWEGTRFAGPWGWSLATKQRYRQMGVPVEALPSDEWLEEVRRLSGRAFACTYIEKMLGKMEDERLLGDEMRWIDRQGFSWDTLDSEVMRMSHTRIFKLPWSSSGRGVTVGDWCEERTRTRVEGMLSSQGGFVVDRFYEDKVLDFAMEFFVHEACEEAAGEEKGESGPSRVEFLGYSVFSTGEHGVYGCNFVESQEALLHRINTDEALLRQLVEYHQSQLAETSYYGPVGIDMLKTLDGKIHPCLEINFRMNMGILAGLLYKRCGDHATVALTPPRSHGFQALIDDGRFMITFRR